VAVRGQAGQDGGWLAKPAQRAKHPSLGSPDKRRLANPRPPEQNRKRGQFMCYINRKSGASAAGRQGRQE
jgi:hypothetical protein